MSLSDAVERTSRRRTVDGGDRMREVVYWLLLFLWFTLPWEGTVRLGGTATIARGAGAIVAVAAVASIAMSGRRTRSSDYIFMLSVFAAWVTLSTYWSVTPDISRQRVFTMLQLVIMVLITWEFAHSRRGVIALMRAWVAGCVVVGTIVILIFATGQAANRYSAPGTSPGDVAYSLLIGIPIAWYLSIRTQSQRMTIIYRLFVPFACFATVLTASRAGLLSMGLALLIVPLTIPHLSTRSRIGILGAIGVLAVVAVQLLGSATGPTARLATTGTEISSGTLDHRTTLWSIAFRVIRDHPFLGLGTGGSKEAVSGQFEMARGIHNTFLSIGVELGLVGLAIFFLVCLSSFYRSLTGLPWLESRLAWVFALVFLVSLTPRHGDYDKSTYALLTLFALMGEVLRPDRRKSTSNELANRRA